MKNTNEYFDLLKEWGDTLIKLQIPEHYDDRFTGGILCPACMLIHGRIGDAMYPFMYLYSVTKDEKYYNAAKLCFKWIKRNMQRGEGRYVNEAFSTWTSITAFYNIQLGELLHNLKAFVKEEDYKEWYNDYKATTEFIYNNFNEDSINWNINYFIAAATSFAIAYRVFDDDKYLKRAREFAKKISEYILDDGLLYGEGSPRVPSKRGCYAMDLGYNVEESLPNLCLYLKYAGDDGFTKDMVIKSMKAHLEFMLPDGCWDNTWGTRSAKWSYWGSRTSDGCQPAYEYMADYDETFFEAAHRNFELYKKCTIDGLLSGGLHHKEMNEPACIHHTFCHMKGLVCMAETERKRKEGVLLPRETFKGIKNFTTSLVTIAGAGDFTATYSADDIRRSIAAASPTGGAVTMLYHKKAGMLLAGGQNEFVLVEPTNMQLPEIFSDISQLPRIEYIADGKKYRNTYDMSANVKGEEIDGKTIYTADGILRNPDLEGEIEFKTEYVLTEDAFVIKALANTDNATYYLPVVSIPDEVIKEEKGSISIFKKDCTVKVECADGIIWEKDRAERFFNVCGGLATAHFKINMPKNKEIEIKITVE